MATGGIAMKMAPGTRACGRERSLATARKFLPLPELGNEKLFFTGNSILYIIEAWNLF